MLSMVIVVTRPTVAIVGPHVEGVGAAGRSSDAGLPRTYSVCVARSSNIADGARRGIILIDECQEAGSTNQHLELG